MIPKNTRGPIKINKINMNVASGRNAGPVPGNNLLSPVLSWSGSEAYMTYSRRNNPPFYSELWWNSIPITLHVSCLCTWISVTGV
jgi:hypothetical protein